MSLTSTMSTHEVLNIEELVTRCMGNVNFAARVLAKFQDRFDEDLRELDEAILSHDAGAVASIAHRIKGASANVAAPQLHQCSSEIEQRGRDGHLADISSSVERLHQEWSRFTDQASALDLSARDVG